jgi:hypothetical protein
VSDSEARAIGDAGLAIYASANRSSYIVGHPQTVRQVEQLLKPLIVADTLQVKPTNQIAGGLVSSLLAQLDNLTPGLTTGTGSAEQLDGAAVHRLLVFGLKDPAQVFRPKAARGVSSLEQLMRGLAANTRVSPAGQVPVQTARMELMRDAAAAGRFWPDLAKRLQALQASLR